MTTSNTPKTPIKKPQNKAKTKKKDDATKESAKAALNSTSFTNDSKPISIYENGKPYTLNVDQVSTYDKNTRIVKNEEYDALYASIKAKGFNQGALDVTQRPGDDPMNVFLKSGGNTTFSILKELYEETGDKKYYSFIGIYHDWTSESDCIIEHLKENVKGTPTFIDTAIGVNQFRIEKQAELNTSLNDKDLLISMNNEGYSKVNNKTLILINFVIDTMWPICPELLKSGLSANKIKDIVKLEKEASTLHVEIFPDLKPADWNKKFIKALEIQEKRCIADEVYDYKELYYSVIDTFEKDDYVKRNRIDLFLDDRINNKKGQAYDPDLLAEEQVKDNTKDEVSSKLSTNTPPEGTQESSTTTIKNTVSQNTVIVDEGDNDDDLSLGDNYSPPLNDDDSVSDSNELIAAKTSTPLNPDNLVISPASAHQIDRGEWTPENRDEGFSIFSDFPITCADTKEVAPLPTSISELRQIMFNKAVIFQRYIRIPVTIVPIDSGVGFVLNKIPDPQTLQVGINLDERDNPRTKLYHKNYIGWWLLLGFTDMLKLNHLRQFDIIEKYQVEGNLKDALMDPMQSYAHIMDLDLSRGITHSATADVAPLFLSDATPKELQLFFELSLTYNTLMRATRADIWSTTGRGVAL